MGTGPGYGGKRTDIADKFLACGNYITLTLPKETQRFLVFCKVDHDTADHIDHRIFTASKGDIGNPLLFFQS